METNETIEAGTIPPEDLAPDTGKPMTKANVARFAIGFGLSAGIMAVSGTLGSAVLFPERFNTLNIGQPEAVLAAMNSVGCVVALIANIIFGALSDRCRSRFGKRTPFIAVGGIITGLAFWMTSQATSLVGVVGSWSLLQAGLNMMIAPLTAIISDRVSLSHRGSVASFMGAGGTAGASLGTIVGTACLANPMVGFLIGTFGYGLVGIFTVSVLPKEQSAAVDEDEKEPFSLASLAKSFAPPTKNCRDFYLALFGRLMLVFGYWIVSGYQLYILEKYIGLEAADAAVALSGMSVIAMVTSLVCSVSGGFISDKIGARKPILFVSTLFLAAGIAAPWLFKSVMGMYGFALLGGIGYGVYGSVDQALNVDVLPNKEEAGKDLGILNIANTIGQVLAPIVTSSVVLATGSYALTFPIAIALVLVGWIFIMLIKSAK